MLQMPSLANRASLTENMNIRLLKTKLLHSTHGIQLDQLQNALPKSMVQKIDGTNA